MNRLKISISLMILALVLTSGALVVSRASQAAAAVSSSASFVTVSASGKVSDQNGLGISKAGVLVSDFQGNTFSTTTNAFGYYQVDGLASGVTYTFTASARGYEFDPQTVTVTNNISNLNFTAK